MAPGLNGGGQSSKNKCTCNTTAGTGARFRVSVRDVLANASSLPWETDSDHRRRSTNPSSQHAESEHSCTCNASLQDHPEPRLSTASTASLVDNDNGELSWSLNQGRSEGAGSTRSFPRSSRQSRSTWMSAERQNAPSPSQGGIGGRGHAPNRQQVASKLAALQDYIEQTEAVMRELRVSDSPACQEQHDKLSALLADLRDSEQKLQGILRTVDRVDAKIDQLLNGSSAQGGSANGEVADNGGDRRVVEHSRKVQALERQRDDLMEMHRVAQQRLAEAEQDRDDLLLRAQAISATGDSEMTARVQALRQREAFREPAEHPDEDRVEADLSDTETDYQLVRDKVEELNALKSQLSQLQNMMAAIGAGSDGKRTSSREIEDAPARVAQLQELNRMVESVRLDRNEPGPSREQRVMDNEMQAMTRQLEEQTAKMRAERDNVLQAREHLGKLLRLAQAHTSADDCSADESDNEPPTLLPVNMLPTPRNAEDGSSGRRAAAPHRNVGDAANVRAPPRPRQRQRSSLNQSLPTLDNVPSEAYRRSKEPRSSQSSIRNGEVNGGRGRSELTDFAMSPDMMNPDAALFQTQNQLDESAQLCEQMLRDSTGRGGGSVSSGGPGADLTGILYSQQQMLTRTVSQCCKLIWLQQRQINELRNAVLLQQSVGGQQQAAPPPTQAGVAGAGYPAYPPPSQLPPQILSDLMRLRLYDNPLPPAANGQVLDCLSPEDLGPSGALNNQVPPGNRANNYWDNFRSYSRQNLLSTSKSNENTEPRRQATNHDRTPQAIVPPNNQSQYPIVQVQPLRQSEGAFDLEMSHAPGPSVAESGGMRNNRTCEVAAATRRGGDQEGARGRNNQVRNLQPPLQDPRLVASSDVTHPHPTRNNNRIDIPLEAPWLEPSEAEAVHSGSPLKSRFHGLAWEEESDRNLHRVRNNTGAVARNRTRHHTTSRELAASHGDDTLTRVRNDTGATTRNRGPEPTHLSPDHPLRPNNRLAGGNLNNQSDAQNSLRMPTSVYQEVTSFIRANETRPNYLIQLFRDLQQVNSDPQRQRALQSLQDVVSANNITQEARNNIRHDNRSNLRRFAEETERIDQLFDQLRDNQNTIRQNIGNAPLEGLANNLENPNISNIRELGHSAPASSSHTRNNLEHNRMRDLQSYFEGNLCHGGPGSSLKNPNLSNIRENLTEGLSEYERMNPKNVYRSLYDSLVEDLRRRGDDELIGMHSPEPPPAPLLTRFFMGDDPRDGHIPTEDNSVSCPTVDREVPAELQMHSSNEFMRYEYPDYIEVGGERKPALFPLRNPASGDEEASSSRSHEWSSPLASGSPFTMFVRPVRYGESSADQAAANADLAESDQSCMLLNGCSLLKEDEIPNHLDEMSFEYCQDTYCTEADANENLVSSEGNNNVARTSRTKNHRDMLAEGGAAKVTKTRLQDALSSGGAGEPADSPPMMDIAGALEHLDDYRPQQEEIRAYAVNNPNLGMEEEAEREAGLDQVPTRLQKSDSPTLERDGAT